MVGPEVGVKQRVTPSRPLIEVRTVDLHFPNAELGAAIDFKQGNRALAGILDGCGCLQFGIPRGIPAHEKGLTLGPDRAVAEAHLWFLAAFEIDGPLEPLRLLAGEFHQGERALRGDVARALDAALAIHCGEFHHDRIAVPIVVDEVVGVRAVDGGGLDANRVAPALRRAASRHRHEPDVPAAVVPRDEIIVARVRHPAIAVGMKQLRQIGGIPSLEIERRFLRVGLRLRFRPKRRCPLNGFLGGDEIVIEQHPRRHLGGGIIVETTDARFRRKIDGGIPSCDVESEQVADGLAVFVAVESAQDRMGCGGFETLRRLTDGGRDRIHGCEQFRFRWLLLLVRRHLALVELIENLLPEQRLVRSLDCGGERIEPPVALLFLGAVALDAVLPQKRFERCSGCQRGDTQNRTERKQPAKSKEAEPRQRRLHGHPIFIGENVPVLRPKRSRSTPNHWSEDSQRLDNWIRLRSSAGHTTWP